MSKRSDWANRLSAELSPVGYQIRAVPHEGLLLLDKELKKVQGELAINTVEISW